MEALDKQIGGIHYMRYPIQPVEYAGEMWGAVPFAYSITKYLVRYKDKNGLEDLMKAMHFCELAMEIMGAWTNVRNLNPRQQAVFNTYIRANGLEHMRTLLLKVAQFDFAGSKRDIMVLIDKEGGDI